MSDVARCYTPEHREEMIEEYMSKYRISRKKAEAYYKWAFPGLSEREIREVHARQMRGIFVGPFDSIDEDGDWFVAGDEFLAQDLGTRTAYLSDKETGATVLYEASLNQLLPHAG